MENLDYSDLVVIPHTHPNVNSAPEGFPSTCTSVSWTALHADANGELLPEGCLRVACGWPDTMCCLMFFLLRRLLLRALGQTDWRDLPEGKHLVQFRFRLRLLRVGVALQGENLNLVLMLPEVCPAACMCNPEGPLPLST
jgi:hypothetical protein